MSSCGGLIIVNRIIVTKYFQKINADYFQFSERKWELTSKLQLSKCSQRKGFEEGKITVRERDFQGNAGKSKKGG